MFNSKSILSSVMLVVVSVGISVFIHQKYLTPKIGYVRTGEIISKYKGLINANKIFSQEVGTVQANIDTLRKRFERLKLQAENKKDQKLWYQVGVSEKEYQNYGYQAQEELKKREQTISGEFIGKINNYVQNYGKTNGYTVVLGTTNNGSVMYGNDNIDLTNTILKELNELYVKDSLSIPNHK